MVILVYVGDGSALINAPARDMTDVEVEECGYTTEELLESGLYEPIV